MNYILQYYQQIKDGSVVVGEWVRLVYEYIVHGLEEKRFFYDAKKAEHAINYIEKFCHHAEGALAPQLIQLELWQKAFVACVFGIVGPDKLRQFREIFLVVGRKNGKSLLLSAIASYCAYADGEYGARVYFTAPKLEQASIAFDSFVETVKKEPVLWKRSKKRRTDVYVEGTNTVIKPLAYSSRKSDGLNCSLVVADEISSWDAANGLKYYEVLKSSQGARKQPLLISISSAGYVNEGPYDELFKRATRLLKGDSRETRLLPVMYTIDDITKWDDVNEWQKSNPNMGVSISVDYLLDELAVAEGSLSKKAEFITKYCNIKQSSSQAWLNAVDVENAYSGEQILPEQFRDCYAICGIDLSRTTDLTAVMFLVERDGIIHIFGEFYLPAEKLQDAIARDGIPYDIYVEKGWLRLSGDNVIDYQDCQRFIQEMITVYHIYPLRVMYDRYSAQYLIKDLEANGCLTDDCHQGYNMTPGIREFEGMLKDRKIDIGNNDLLKIHLLNAALQNERQTERVKLVKYNQYAHIDGTAAIIDAMIGRQKYWAEIGPQLTNNRGNRA
jgi:phage terminase large subunit-like protein